MNEAQCSFDTRVGLGWTENLEMKTEKETLDLSVPKGPLVLSDLYPEFSGSTLSTQFYRPDTRGPVRDRSSPHL